MTLGLFLLRAFQIGLSMDDLDTLEKGVILDMMVESANDDAKFRTIATQEDMDRF